MALAEALHHSSGLEVMERAQHAALRGQKTGTRAGVAGPAPVTEYVAPAPAVAPFSSPAVTFVAPAPVIDYVAPAHSVTHAVPAPVIDYVTPAPVFGFIAPAPAGSFVAPCQQLRPAYADDAAVVVSASQVIPLRVVGSLHAEEFTVYVARRPPPLFDVRPSSRAQRHFMEDLGELAPSVQLLDLPVPQMVENVIDTLLRILDFPIAEQVIDVPKIFCAPCPSRSQVPEPQSAEQLVEVPTVLTPTRLAVQIAEQIVDTSARGSLPGQRSAARRLAQSSWRRFSGRIWHMPAAGLPGYIASDSAKAAYAFVGDVPFFLEGFCQLGDHVSFAVGRGAG